MSEEGDGGQGGCFLSTVLGSGRGDDSCELLAQSLLHPETAGGIKEGRELADSATVTLLNNNPSVHAPVTKRMV